jgi:rod shape-determining protein MreC
MNRDHRVANYLLFGFSAISLVLLSLPLSGKVLALRSYASYLLNPIPYYGGGAVNRLKGLPENAARLIAGDVELLEARRRLKEAGLLAEELNALREENARLRESVGLSPRGARRVRWAEVLQRDSLQWHRSIRIAAGSRDGVRINAPVLGLYEGRLGVVGRITRVFDKTATVLLVTDELSAVAARISGRWEGLVQGQGNARLRMNYLPLQTDFSLGEMVRTSRTSAAFPPGIAVGRVSRVFEPDQFLAFQTVELEPAVPAASLQEVLILDPVLNRAAGPAEPEFSPPKPNPVSNRVRRREAPAGAGSSALDAAGNSGVPTPAAAVSASTGAVRAPVAASEPLEGGR